MIDSRRNIVVVGGNFVNKGAQSMLYCLVNHLMVKYPDKKVVMLDLFPVLSAVQKQKYRFTILNMHVRTLFRISVPFLKLLFKKSPKSDDEQLIIDSIRNASVVYDISGYGVSSHNQALVWTLATLLPFRLAAKHNVPVQLMPQSLGPFEYKGWQKWLVWPFVKKYMKVPVRIFIREPISRNYLNFLNRDVIVDSFDLVLQSKKLDAAVFMNEATTFEIPKLAPQSVVLIPNRQLFRLWGKDNTIVFFSELVNVLNNNGKNVVVLRHSSDDASLCQNIIDRVSPSEHVTLLSSDFEPQQLDDIICQAEALVSARYHGLVHGLKNGIPVFSVGWAVKYNHLMQSFGLDEYHIGHNELDLENSLNRKLSDFLTQLPSLQQHIRVKIDEVLKNSIYNTYL